MTSEHYSILYHTAHRAAGGYYCGGGPIMADLVARGLMQSAGRKSFVPDEYFQLTSAGRAALAQWTSEQPKPKPARPRQSAPFRTWRDHYSHQPFPQFLRTTWKHLTA